jgi:transposase-like protein
MRKREHFNREFKLEAVRLLEEGKKPAADLARELGLRRNQLYKWKDAIDRKGEDAFPGQGRRSGTETQAGEITRLKRELFQAQEDVEILKKAAAFFAKELR